ncbi:hypothetical protein AcV7_006113 [Taiwanofungus camphoratus]|nr:hypothetical protein AcV7_006113 [Antrodia cinnamomea]
MHIIAIIFASYHIVSPRPLIAIVLCSYLSTPLNTSPVLSFSPRRRPLPLTRPIISHVSASPAAQDRRSCDVQRPTSDGRVCPPPYRRLTAVSRSRFRSSGDTAVAASNPPARSQQLASRPRPLRCGGGDRRARFFCRAGFASSSTGLLATPVAACAPERRVPVIPARARITASTMHRVSDLLCRRGSSPPAPSVLSLPPTTTTHELYTSFLLCAYYQSRYFRSSRAFRGPGGVAGRPTAHPCSRVRAWPTVGPRGGGLSVLVIRCLYISPAYAPPRLIPSACGPSVPCSIFAALRLRPSLPPSLPRTYVHTSPLSRFLLLDF